MLSRFTATVARRATSFAAVAPRTFTSLDQALTADDAWRKSGYVEIDYTINDEAYVYDAVQKLAAFNIGCLVTVDNGKSVCVCVCNVDRQIGGMTLIERASTQPSAANLLYAWFFLPFGRRQNDWYPQ